METPSIIMLTLFAQDSDSGVQPRFAKYKVNIIGSNILNQALYISKPICLFLTSTSVTIFVRETPALEYFVIGYFQSFKHEKHILERRQSKKKKTETRPLMKIVRVSEELY